MAGETGQRVTWASDKLSRVQPQKPDLNPDSAAYELFDLRDHLSISFFPSV